MTPGRLLRWCKFTLVPSHGSAFVYMIPPQNTILAQVTPKWVHPSCCTRARISLQYETLQWSHVNTKQAPVLVWNRSARGLERVVNAQCLRFWITCAFYQHGMNLQITKIWNSPSSCKHDMKSKSHAIMKCALVRVFSCKHPLRIPEGTQCQVGQE